MNLVKKSINHSFSNIILIIGIVIVAVNLRPAITSVGPLVGMIRDDLNLANWNTGLITSLPLLAFAAMSPIAPKLSNRFGNERTLLLGLLLLFIGICTRSLSYTPTVYIGTTLVGLGIAVCNVLLPGVIKEKFPNKLGIMTGMYTTLMSVFAAIASGLSVPLTNLFTSGWQASLLSWAALALLGVIVWIFIYFTNNDEEKEARFYEPSAGKLLKSSIAWQVTLFMGLQSFLFYVTVTWLPEILIYGGLSTETSGWLLSFMLFIGLPATFYTPIIASRVTNQKSIIIAIGLSAALGYGGLLLGGPMLLIIVSITLIGSALGSSISLSLAFIGMRTRNGRQAAELSGMAQSFGYLLAATGPMLIGLLFDISNQWTIPLLATLLIVGILIVFGLGAARDKYVFDDNLESNE